MSQSQYTRCTICQTINHGHASFCWLCKAEELVPIEDGPNPLSTSSTEPIEEAYIGPFSHEGLAQGDFSSDGLSNRQMKLSRKSLAENQYLSWLILLVIGLVAAFELLPLIPFLPGWAYIAISSLALFVTASVFSFGQTQTNAYTIFMLFLILTFFLLPLALFISFLQSCSALLSGL